MHILKRAAHRIQRTVKKLVRLHKARRQGLRYVSPNFLYRPELGQAPVVIDAGCSYQADFSLYMIRQHGAKAYGVDPTHKHQPALKALEEKLRGSFHHIPVAISGSDGSLTFYESKSNESGSLMTEHVNVRTDETISYEVEALTLKSLLARIGLKGADILKLDLEGAEYELLHALERSDLLPFNQVFVEFHHHAIGGLQEADTWKLVDRICSFGFQSASLDDHNFLFLRS